MIANLGDENWMQGLSIRLAFPGFSIENSGRVVCCNQGPIVSVFVADRFFHVSFVRLFVLFFVVGFLSFSSFFSPSFRVVVH